MTLDDFVHVARRITYKPNAKIEVFPDMRQLRVSFHVEDTTAAGGARIHISLSYPIPSYGLFKDGVAIAHWILQCVYDAESHETREWFKLDGVAIFDPHKESPLCKST